MSTTYTYRLKPMSSVTLLRLEPGRLVAGGAGKSISASYRDIAAIRLSFMPRGQYLSGFRCKIFIAGGKTITLDDSTFTSFFIQEKQSQAYRTFVLDLIERVRGANPAARIIGGRGFWPQAATVVMGVLVGVVLPVFAFTMLQSGQWLTGLMFAGFAAVFIGWTWMFIRRNRQRILSDGDIPAELIPPAGDASDD